MQEEPLQGRFIQFRNRQQIFVQSITDSASVWILSRPVQRNQATVRPAPKSAWMPRTADKNRTWLSGVSAQSLPPNRNSRKDTPDGFSIGPSFDISPLPAAIFAFMNIFSSSCHCKSPRLDTYLTIYPKLNGMFRFFPSERLLFLHKMT